MSQSLSVDFELTSQVVLLLVTIQIYLAESYVWFSLTVEMNQGVLILFTTLSLIGSSLAIVCYTCRSIVDKGCETGDKFDPQLFDYRNASNCTSCKLEYATLAGVAVTNRTCESACQPNKFQLKTGIYELKYQSWCCDSGDLCNKGRHPAADVLLTATGLSLVWLWPFF